jgi:membrane-associated phospholipid phosphatase
LRDHHLFGLGRLISFITDFGDAAILLPISATVLFCLMATKAYRVAAAWSLAIALCLGVMVVLKLAFRSCGDVWTDNAIISPSGHTAFSTTVYGGLAGLLTMRTTHSWIRIATPVLALGWIVAIGVSRILLQAHSPAEVAVGWAVGAVLVSLFCVLTWRTPLERSPLLVIGGFVLGLLLLLHGRHAGIEELLIRIAALIRHRFPVCG